jgi:GTP-binding protein
LKVLSANFVTSVGTAGTGIPHDAPQVALVGRSNVGKSSLINALAHRKIARTSAAPGKTRLVNIYCIEIERGRGPGRSALYLVDLPGYGYARRSRASRRPAPIERGGGDEAAAELGAVAETYFSGGKRPRDAEKSWQSARLKTKPASALLLVDSRHPGLESDIAAARWLESMGVATHIVATKIDKLTRSERARNLKTLGNTFGSAVLPVSAVSGEGLDDLWRMIAVIGKDEDRHE